MILLQRGGDGGPTFGRNDFSQLDDYLNSFFARMLGRPPIPEYQCMVTFSINIMARHCCYAAGRLCRGIWVRDSIVCCLELSALSFFSSIDISLSFNVI